MFERVMMEIVEIGKVLLWRDIRKGNENVLNETLNFVNC
jgi:hypothetical protein